MMKRERWPYKKKNRDRKMQRMEEVDGRKDKIESKEVLGRGSKE